jgi:hypothetical protein
MPTLSHATELEPCLSSGPASSSPPSLPRTRHLGHAYTLPCHRAGALPFQRISLLPAPYLASGTSSGPSLHPPYHRSGALPCQLTSLPPSAPCLAPDTSFGPSLRLPLPLRRSPALPAATPLPRSLPIRRLSTPAHLHVPLRWSPALPADQPPPCSLPSLIPVRQTQTSLPKPLPSFWLSASNTSTGPSLRLPVLLRWSPALPADQPPPRSQPSLIPVRQTPASLPKPSPSYWLSASNTSTGPSLRLPVPLRWSPALPADQPPPCSLPSLIPVRQIPTFLPKPPPSYGLLASNTSTGPSLRLPVPLRWSPAFN